MYAGVEDGGTSAMAGASNMMFRSDHVIRPREYLQTASCGGQFPMKKKQLWARGDNFDIWFQ